MAFRTQLMTRALTRIVDASPSCTEEPLFCDPREVFVYEALAQLFTVLSCEGHAVEPRLVHYGCNFRAMGLKACTCNGIIRPARNVKLKTQEGAVSEWMACQEH